MGTVVNVTLGDDTRLNLILGQQLENAVTAVVFDFSAWKTEFGSGTVGLSVQRHKDKMPYAVVPTVSGTNATWNITETDTGKNGVGEVQVTYTVGSVVKKSVVYKFTVYRSLGEDGEYPVPGQGWMEDIEDRLEALEQGGSGSGLTDAEKSLILTLFNQAAYAGNEAGTAYNQLSNLWSGYSITWSGSGYTHSNNSSSITGGSTFTSTVSASSGFTITGVVATMGGNTVQGAWQNGTVTIPNVTGNIVITVTTSQATVSSISAVYTQSGTVYDSDTLDSLKSDLVVTATYVDQSTYTVPSAEYTLSGTLTEGTSTITVSYGGKTTTFNVTVTHYVEETVALTWTGSGNDKKTNLIDATIKTAYFTLPFVAESSNLSSGATAESLGVKEYVEIYSAESGGTTRIGYYYTDTQQIESGRSVANSPWVPFDTEDIFIPQGYYGKIVLSRVNTDAFPDNSNFLQYLNANATEAVMR